MTDKALNFSAYLGPSAESSSFLIQRNESEVKLLEDIRIYIDKRSKIDAEYADKISKLHNTVKGSFGGMEDDSFLQKVWRNYNDFECSIMC